MDQPTTKKNGTLILPVEQAAALTSFPLATLQDLAERGRIRAKSVAGVPYVLWPALVDHLGAAAAVVGLSRDEVPQQAMSVEERERRLHAAGYVSIETVRQVTKMARGSIYRWVHCKQISSIRFVAKIYLNWAHLVAWLGAYALECGMYADKPPAPVPLGPRNLHHGPRVAAGTTAWRDLRKRGFLTVREAAKTANLTIIHVRRLLRGPNPRVRVTRWGSSVLVHRDTLMAYVDKIRGTRARTARR